MNETVDRVGLKYARKVFRDGFVRHRDGFVVHVPTVPLGRLYGDELRAWLTSHGVEVRENTGVKKASDGWDGEGNRIARRVLTLRGLVRARGKPFDRVADMLPEELLSREPYFGNVRNLAPSPITSVHLWFDQKV